MRRLLCTALVAFLVTACSNGPSKPGPTDGASLNFDEKAAIVVDDTGIRPEITRVRVGDAIRVINRGTKDHGLTSDTIDTGTLQPDDSTTVFLTEPGSIELRDRADPSHTARIEVSA